MYYLITRTRFRFCFPRPIFFFAKTKGIYINNDIYNLPLTQFGVFLF